MPRSVQEIFDDSKRSGSVKRFHSQFVCLEEGVVFEEGKLCTFPYVVGRYRTCLNDVYGKSPAMEALPAIRRLNEITNELAQFALFNRQRL